MLEVNVIVRSHSKNLIPAFSIFILVGCSNSTDANKENFSKSVQDYLTQEMACLKIGSRYLNKGLQSQYLDLNELVKIGLLKKESLAPKSALTRRIDPTVRYSLTEQGQKISKTNKGRIGSVTRLCYGDNELVGITNFTKPADMRGRTVSKVRYTYKVTNIADWAKTESVVQKFESLKEKLNSDNTPLKGKATLVLTNNGWIHTKLLEK